MKKTFLIAAVALGALTAGAAAAQESSLSYNVSVQSNYVWRGASQTDNGSSVQGGIDYSNGIFYAGTWLAGGIDFGTDDSTELDFYLGVKPSVGDYSFDFGAIAYSYNVETDTTTELKAAVSHPMGKGTIGAAMYVNADTLEKPYYEINMAYPVGEKLSVSGAIGNCEGGVCNGLGNYVTYNVGATYAINDNVSVDLRYSDLSHSVKADWAKATTFVTLKAAF